MVLLTLEDTGDGLVVRLSNPLLLDIISCITEGKPVQEYLREKLADSKLEVMENRALS